MASRKTNSRTLHKKHVICVTLFRSIIALQGDCVYPLYVLLTSLVGVVFLMTIILYAIPGFFLLMAIELIVDRVKGTGYYRLNDAIASLSVGMLSRVAAIIKALIPLSIYGLVVDDIALVQWPVTVFAWIAAFVLYDFLYYWNHRLGHEMSVLWAAHVVHHSSEEYNLTTALRQTSGSFINWLFFIPMAFLGIPLETMVSIAAINLVYQYWVHTRHIDTLGALDRILVTPSNHRVHHAQNDKYIDKNYGGVFILWDRLFGTFEPEDKNDLPIYGIRTPLKSYNPLWTNFHQYKQLISDSWHTASWRDKFRVWFGRTGYRPDDVLAKEGEKADFDPAKFVKHDIPLSVTEKGYALIQLLAGLVLTLSVLLSLGTMQLNEQLLWCTILVAYLTSLGFVIERKNYAPALEVSKWLLLFAGFYWLSSPGWAAATLIAMAGISALWLVAAKLWLTTQPLSNKSDSVTSA